MEIVNSNEINITVYGDCPSTKNARRTVVKNGKTHSYKPKNIQKFEQDALVQLSAFKGQPEGKVTICYMFYVGNRRRRDTDNMVTTINDVLVKSGLLEDDDYTHLSLGSADAEYDPDSPRIELTIIDQQD